MSKKIQCPECKTIEFSYFDEECTEYFKKTGVFTIKFYCLNCDSVFLTTFKVVDNEVV